MRELHKTSVPSCHLTERVALIQAFQVTFLNTRSPPPHQPSLLQEAAFLEKWFFVVVVVVFITFLLSKQRETSRLDSSSVEKKTVSADFETFIQKGAKENIHFLHNIP